MSYFCCLCKKVCILYCKSCLSVDLSTKKVCSLLKTPSKAPYATLAIKEVNVCIGTAYYVRVSEAGNFILPVQLCNVENNWRSSGMMK